MAPSSNSSGLIADNVGRRSLRVSEEILQDLARSGLLPEDMQIRQLDASEKATTGCGVAARGYAIPYFDINGRVLPFYRVKIVNSDVEAGVKYRQPRGTANHIYFPPGFKACLHNWLQKYPAYKLIIITEGEKKAASCVRQGIPCVALGGVDSWRSRTIMLPRDSELIATKKAIRARLPGTDTSIPEVAQLAQGFSDLMDYILQFNITPMIIYDSDYNGTLKSEVQRAATMLAYEFRYLGIPSSRIKQLILPDVYKDSRDISEEGIPDDDDEDTKVGLDDYLMTAGSANLAVLLKKAMDDPESFPKHPNTKGYLNVHLNGILDRRSLMQISSVILSELDASGTRFREAHSGKPYYFDRKSYKLMPAQIVTTRGEVMHESPMGILLYQKFGLTSSDQKVLSWLAGQFTGEEPIVDVTPRRIKTLITEAEDPMNPHGIAIQMSDTHFVAISPNPRNPVELLTNGSKGILFEAEQVKALDVDLMMDYFDQFREEAPTLTPWWLHTLEDTNLGRAALDITDLPGSGGDGKNAHRTIMTAEGKQLRVYASLLFYLSPFLQRWRGLQLPVEIMIGEAGSGKSSLYSLRLQILTGQPHLRNIPNDLKDWNASITNSGGLMVFDNVHFSKKDLKQSISDEICRLTTEPTPHIELRKYFTTSDLIRIPVDVAFAFTAISQPFINADLFQRAASFNLIKIGSAPEGDWVDKQLTKHGGREAWMAHYLVFLHRFLAQASRAPEHGGWSQDYRSSHRLSNLEQALEIASGVLGIETRRPAPESPDDSGSSPDGTTDTTPNMEHLNGDGGIGAMILKSQERNLAETDWTFEGITAFAAHQRSTDPGAKFLARDINQWAIMQEDFQDNPVLNNTRRLGKYMRSHPNLLLQSILIAPAGIFGNAQRYKLLDRPPALTRK